MYFWKKTTINKYQLKTRPKQHETVGLNLVCDNVLWSTAFIFRTSIYSSSTYCFRLYDIIVFDNHVIEC